jgi:hypothetical protein
MYPEISNATRAINPGLKFLSLPVDFKYANKTNKNTRTPKIMVTAGIGKISGK